MSPPALFDRHLRRTRRDRAARSGVPPLLHQHAFADILERLQDVRRVFGDTLLLGCLDPEWPARLGELVARVTVADPCEVTARRCSGVVVDEDRLPFANGAFDLIIAVGTLDAVDDLPGALVLLRRILRPDGMMLAAMTGAGSLPRLRSAMLAADAVQGAAAARMHPAVDVRTAGDLLARAGFALPVADGYGLDVSYPDLRKLVADVRAHGAGNILARRSRIPLGRKALAAAAADFASYAVDGRTVERVELLFMSGWSPVFARPDR